MLPEGGNSRQESAVLPLCVWLCIDRWPPAIHAEPLSALSTKVPNGQFHNNFMVIYGNFKCWGFQEFLDVSTQRKDTKERRAWRAIPLRALNSCKEWNDLIKHLHAQNIPKGLQIEKEKTTVHITKPKREGLGRERRHTELQLDGSAAPVGVWGHGSGFLRSLTFFPLSEDGQRYIRALRRAAGAVWEQQSAVRAGIAGPCGTRSRGGPRGPRGAAPPQRWAGNRRPAPPAALRADGSGRPASTRRPRCELCPPHRWQKMDSSERAALHAPPRPPPNPSSRGGGEMERRGPTPPRGLRRAAAVRSAAPSR